MTRYVSVDSVIQYIASNKEFCDELSKRLEIEAFEEDAGEVVQYVMQEWAKQRFDQYAEERRNRFLSSLGGAEARE